MARAVTLTLTLTLTPAAAAADYPASFKYTEDHEWIEVGTSPAKLGITDFAQNEVIALPQLTPDNPTCLPLLASFDGHAGLALSSWPTGILARRDRLRRDADGDRRRGREGRGVRHRGECEGAASPMFPPPPPPPLSPCPASTPPAPLLPAARLQPSLHARKAISGCMCMRV